MWATLRWPRASDRLACMRSAASTEVARRPLLVRSLAEALQQRWPRHQLGDRARIDKLAALETAGLMGKVDNEVHVLVDDNDRQIRAGFLQRLEDLVPADRIDAGC